MAYSFCDLSPIKDNEIDGRRPVIVVSRDYNNSFPIVTIIPLTKFREGRYIYKNEVKIHKNRFNMLDYDSIALANQIRSVSVNRMIKRIGRIEDKEIKQKIEMAIAHHLFDLNL